MMRFTPTGVGRTPSTRSGRRPDGGSPPRAWGGRRVDRNLAREERFTPTGVGRTRRARRTRGTRAVHPHGRGEDALH